MERLQTDPGFSIHPPFHLTEGSLQPAPLCPQLSGLPSSFLVLDGYEYIYAISITDAECGFIRPSQGAHKKTSVAHLGRSSFDEHWALVIG